MAPVELVTSFIVALGLAMDAFAVSIGLSTSGRIKLLRSKVRLAGHFGIFQLGMTVVGWLAGETIVALVEDYDHWLALGLLAYVGVNLIRSGLSNDDKGADLDPSKGWSLVLLSVATSLDALAVGLSLAMIETNIIVSALVIGLVAFTLSSFGLFTGHKLGQVFGKRMEIIGGILLIGIGLQIFLSHMA